MKKNLRLKRENKELHKKITFFANGKVHHNPADRPVREIKNYVHGKVGEVEKDNSCVEGAHKLEKVTEKAGGYTSQKLKEDYQTMPSHHLLPLPCTDTNIKHLVYKN